MKNQLITITKIEKQDDKVLLYGLDKNYYIIAEVNSSVKVGDRIEYEPYGANFGWFVRLVCHE